MEDVYVLHRRQALDLEVARAPELEALGHHGMDPAVDALLLEATLSRAQGEVLHGAHARAVARGGHHADHSPQAPREAGRLDDGAQLGHHRVRLAVGAVLPQVEVEHHVAAGGHGLDERAQRLRAASRSPQGAQVAITWIRDPSCSPANALTKRAAWQS